MVGAPHNFFSSAFTRTDTRWNATLVRASRDFLAAILDHATAARSRLSGDAPPGVATIEAHDRPGPAPGPDARCSLAP
jgi:hypothetical protein